jgi:DNA helicase-2/ATP-dependent DNA helicase PcrA
MTKKFPVIENSKYLKGLNDGQRQAVTTIEGAIQICAVAGSGKTRVLVNRLAYMIQDLGINPSCILATTFTKQAAGEMKSRLTEMLTAKELSALTLGTSHSIARSMLAEEYKETGHPLYMAVSMRDRRALLKGGFQKIFCNDIIKEILKDATIEDDIKNELKSIKAKSLLSAIGLLKNKNIDHIQHYNKTVQEYTNSPKALAYAEFYRRYEQKKQAEKKIDFDDMLFLTVRYFENNPDALKKYQGKYHYVHVDETQDNNSLQYKLCKMLAYPHNNIFVVGDDDQSMYTFRGAEPDNFIRFNEQYSNVQQIPLLYNYRSKKDILVKANKLIAYNENRIIKHLDTLKTDEEQAVFYNHYRTAENEAEAIVKEMQTLNETESVRWDKMFVLYRMNAQSALVEEALIMAGIPYVIHGSISFFQRKEVQDILAYLRLAINNKDNESYKRVYNVPSRYLGNAFFEKLKTIKGSHWTATDKLTMKDYESKGVKAFKMLVNDISDLITCKEKSISDIIDFIMTQEYNISGNKYTSYGEYLKGDIDLTEGDNEEETEQAENEIVSMLKHLTQRFETVNDLISYIDTMQGKRKGKDKSDEEDNEKLNAVQLMTIHKSKGLEADTVFAIGWNEGILPHYRAVEAYQEGTNMLAIEEERRLAYVDATRAENRLYISSTSQYNSRVYIPSRFTEEMELIQEESEYNDDDDEMIIEENKESEYV